MRLILALLLTLISVPVVGQVPLDTVSADVENVQEEAQDNQQNSPAEPSPEQQIVIPLQSDGADDTANANADEGRSNQNSQANEPMFQWPPRFTAQDTYAQWVMALFGIIATGISIYAVILLRGTLKHTAAAANSTRDTLTIAEKTLKATRKNTRTELRAYMTPGQRSEDVIIDEATGNVVSIEIRINWQNSGDTPARNVKVMAASKVHRRNEVLITFDLKDGLNSLDGTIVGPNGTWGSDSIFSITKVKICVEDGCWAVVHSLIEYEDIFGRAYQGESTFKIDWGIKNMNDILVNGHYGGSIKYQAVGSQNREIEISKE